MMDKADIGYEGAYRTFPYENTMVETNAQFHQLCNAKSHTSKRNIWHEKRFHYLSLLILCSLPNMKLDLFLTVFSTTGILNLN